MEFFTPVNRAPTGFFERRKSFRSLQRFVEYIIEDFRVALNFLSNRGSFFCNVGIRASSRFVNIPLTGFLERFSSCANSLPRFLLFVSFTESDIGYIRFSWIFFSILVLIKQNFSSTRWSFFWKDSSSFFPNKRDYLRAVSLYYSFDSVHPEFRTWIYIGNMSNTRLTLLWENINFFFSLCISVIRSSIRIFACSRKTKKEGIASIVILEYVVSESEGFITLIECDVYRCLFWNFVRAHLLPFDRVERRKNQ